MFQSDLMAGKRVLVTGGGTGLGKAIGHRCLELGASLIICGRRREVLDGTKAAFDESFPGRTTVHPCDVRDADAVEAMLDAVFADGPIDMLVNNAAGNFLAKSEELTPRGFDAVTRIVLNGTAYVTLGTGRRWIAAGRGGSIVSMVTTYTRSGSPYVLPSACAKAGVEAMTRSLAVEWGPKGIRCNAVAPGPFPTEGAWSRLVPTDELNDAWLNRVPMRRFGAHRELADLVVFLLSDNVAYVNGDTVTIDGGEWLKGAAQFSFVEELSENDWAAMAPKKKGG